MEEIWEQMNGPAITLEGFKERVKEYFKGLEKPGGISRSITLHTGVGGYNLFGETVDDQRGFKRIYIGKKVPRILRKLNFTILRAPIGKYYKLVRKEQGV